MLVRSAVQDDAGAIWKILEPVVRAGESYTLPCDLRREDALAYWFAKEHEVFAAVESSAIVATYFLQANQRGRGSHVANCGYVTAAESTGRGVARSMCLHSLEHARGRGFLAMQFNFVVSSNERAVRLWESLGFEIACRLPAAFQHPTLGFVDALVMYRKL